MSKLVTGLSDLVVKKYRTTMLIKDMDIARLMTHAQQIEVEKLKNGRREIRKLGLESLSIVSQGPEEEVVHNFRAIYQCQRHLYPVPLDI